MSTNFRPTPGFASRLNQEIFTERLFLEPLLASHADALFQPLSDKRIYQWIDAGGPKDLEQLRSKWKEVESRIAPSGGEVWLNWAIQSSKEGSYIGKIDAELDSPTNVANIGYCIFPNYWGLGYATESVRAVTSWLIKNGIRKMLATVSTPNLASSRVLEKVGFIRGKLSSTEKDTYEYSLIVSSSGEVMPDKAMQADASGAADL